MGEPQAKAPGAGRRRKISAIIACYRDAQAVPHMYRRLAETFAKIGVDYEIIFVNDNSPDNAQEVLEELAGRDPKVVVIKHTRNFGSQNAFTSGMQIATGDGVVLLDGDLQDPPELIEQFYAKWLEGYDVVYGQRVKREATAFLRFAYKAFYRVFKSMAYVAVPLDAGDFSLLDRRVVDALNALPENNRFVRGLRAWVGFRQVGVPYVRPERMFGRTTNSMVKNLWWARKAIVSFSYKPLDFITWVAFFTMLVSLGALVVQVVLRLVFPNLAPRGFTSLTTIILFLGGIQLLCLSIIASYLEQIYDEVKRRPPYVVDRILNDPTASPRPADAKRSEPL